MKDTPGKDEKGTFWIYFLEGARNYTVALRHILQNLADVFCNHLFRKCCPRLGEESVCKFS
jgi:hypothetical protein